MRKVKKAAKHQEPPKPLKGWKAIGAYLGIGAATAQHWAKSGMPVRREGRYTTADAAEIREWLGREAHMPAPAHVVTNDADISAALKDSISAVRRKRTD
jgi:NAD(P)-dependent dehydrogenase (short-subunit alcohol dehydrogenase family)